MTYQRICITVLCSFFFPVLVAAGDRDVVVMDDVIVTAARTPTLASELARSVIVLDRNDIADARSIEELLVQAAGVDIRRRGQGGVQSDLSIRGTNFEQTLVLIDGIKVSDPQTGHHTLDLPLELDDIERIEILRGPGSRLYGPNAVGGVIQIITRVAAGRRLRLKMTGGDFGLFERTVSLSLPIGPSTHGLTLSQRQSTGYRDNTEFDVTSAAYAASIATGVGSISVDARYGEKDFGAHRFYSDAYPDEYEATETTLLSARGDLTLGNVTARPRLFWRRHDDDFILDRNRPDWYRNRHSTDVYGGEWQGSLTTEHVVATVGGELAGENIASSSFGDHFRLRHGLFAELTLAPFDRLSIITGLSLYRYGAWAWQAWPGIDVGYSLDDNIRIYASVGKAFRVPTFTELYYVSPANMGNPDLRPERSWTYEGGMAWRSGAVALTPAVFMRRGRDLIDWARTSPDDPWTVRNVSSATTVGVETRLHLTPTLMWESSPLTSLSLQYAWLDVERDASNWESKYILDNLRHQVILDLAGRLSGSLFPSARLRYQQRQTGDDYVVVDAHLSWKKDALELFADASNLFDRSHSEIGTIPMPGRWVRVGVSYSLTGE